MAGRGVTRSHRRPSWRLPVLLWPVKLRQALCPDPCVWFSDAQNAKRILRRPRSHGRSLQNQQAPWGGCAHWGPADLGSSLRWLLPDCEQVSQLPGPWCSHLRNGTALMAGAWQAVCEADQCLCSSPHGAQCCLGTRRGALTPAGPSLLSSGPPVSSCSRAVTLPACRPLGDLRDQFPPGKTCPYSFYGCSYLGALPIHQLHEPVFPSS